MYLGKLVLAATLFFGTPAAAEHEPADLDFLAGEWAIHDSSGVRIGSSRIVVQAKGAMLFEERQVPDGKVQPLWFENSEKDGGWTQLFVGPAGKTREFHSTSKMGEWPIIMGRETILADGKPTVFRLRMERLSNDKTRRLLESSRDAGTSWNTVFDYTYIRLR
jgi:hypothetical protein